MMQTTGVLCSDFLHHKRSTCFVVSLDYSSELKGNGEIPVTTHYPRSDANPITDYIHLCVSSLNYFTAQIEISRNIDISFFTKFITIIIQKNDEKQHFEM